MQFGNQWYVGTGFVMEVNREKVICTVAHNIINRHRDDRASRVIVTLNQKGSRPPVQVDCDIPRSYVAGTADVALLRLKNSSYLAYVDALPMWSSSSPPALGSQCYMVGNPLGFDSPSVSEGVIRDINFSDGNLVESVVTSVPVLGGNSGSPILSGNGEVIGILSYGVGGGQDNSLSCLNWGASWRVIREVMVYMKQRSRNFVGGYLGPGSRPLPRRAHPSQSNGTPLIGYVLSRVVYGIQSNESILQIEVGGRWRDLGCYPGYSCPVELYLTPGVLRRLRIGGPRGSRIIAIRPLAIPRSLDIPSGESASSSLKGELLGPVLSPKENSPESAQDG
jgi:S1-C subfamily serine protease